MKDVTLCFTCCGELTEKECLKSIEPLLEQGCQLQKIENVFPQIKALNQMIEQCDTQWLIPLDSDIVLDSDAWNRIKNAINKHRHNPNWHSILFPLWDTLTEKKILALKILRTKIAKENMFIESSTPDVEHYQRLTSKGYTCIHDYLKQKPIGKHIVKGKHFCYFKFRDIYQTYRNYNFEWDSGVFMGGKDLRSCAKAHFNFLICKYIITEDKDYLHCIAGMMDGIFSPLKNESKNLKHKKYMIKSKDAIHHFFNWYMEPIYKDGSGLMLF